MLTAKRVVAAFQHSIARVQMRRLIRVLRHLLHAGKHFREQDETEGQRNQPLQPRMFAARAPKDVDDPFGSTFAIGSIKHRHTLSLDEPLMLVCE